VEKEFVELIRKHSGILHKICNVYFYQNPYKDDYYQEILIRLWKAYPGFNHQSAFSTWMYRVALNSAIDLIRKQRIRPVHIELSKKEYSIPANEEGAGAEDKDKLYEAIRHLTNIDKAIIMLYLEDYDYKEIAEITGFTESNTGVKINRIKKQLIKLLDHGQQ